MLLLKTPIACSALLCGAAPADTLGQTLNFSFLPNDSQVLMFDRFDTQGGLLILTGVEVSVAFLKTGGSYQVDKPWISTATTADHI